MTEDQITSLQRDMREGFAALEGRMNAIEHRLDATDKILAGMATKGDVYQAVVSVFVLIVGMSALVLLALDLGGAFGG